MALDIYTIGGGEIIHETLKAVSLCLNGGQGVLQGLIRIGGISGIFVIYYMFVVGNVEYIMKKWAIPMTLMLSFLFVPQTTVWVHDDISKFHMKLDHVPLGLGQFASHISKIGRAVTSTVEQAFSLPDDLKYHKSGMVFGSDIMEKAKEFKIVNQNFRENIKNFVGQCVKYDIMLNNKYTFDQLRDAPDLWELITSNPSKTRGMFWIPLTGGKASYVTCEGAVSKFNATWKSELERISFEGAKRMFSGRSIGHSSLNGNKLKMSSQLMTLLRNEFMMNLQSTYSYLGDLAYSAEEALKQNVMINAINDASSENSRNAGNPVSYAEMKSILQQNYTFDTIGRLAAKVLPIMKAVLEALVYACFIFVIPLAMLPSGYKFLISWGSVLLWLNFWPPVYAILNTVMNIAARSSSIAEIGLSKGVTIANVAGLASANSEIKVLSGYLALMVPFICIALVKGVGSFIHLAGQMTGVTASSAGSSVGEITSGNLSYGNVSLGNMQMGNTTQFQKNMNSLIASGGHKVDTGGVQITQDAGGWSVMNRAQDTGARSLNGSFADAYSQMNSIRMLESEQKSLQTRYSEAKNTAQSVRAQFSERIANTNAEDISKSHQMSIAQAKTLTEAARQNTLYEKAKHFSSGTNAQGGFALGINAGGGNKIPRNTSQETEQSGGKAKNLISKLASLISISGSTGTSVQASNSRNHNMSENIVDEEAYSKNQSIIENGMKQIAQSERNDELTSLAKEGERSIQEINSLAKDMAINQAKIKQADQAFQNTVTNTISSNNNYVEDFVEVAKERNPNLTTNQAKELFFSGDRNDPLRQKVIQSVMRRNNQHHTFAISQPDTSKLNFNESDLKTNYNAKAQATQTSIDNAEENIAEAKENNEITKELISEKVNRMEKEARENLTTGKSEVETKGEAIKQSVKKREKDGALWTAGREALTSMKTIVKDNDKEDW